MQFKSRPPGFTTLSEGDNSDSEYTEPEIKPPSINRRTGGNQKKMTINEMLLLDVGSEDEILEYYKSQVESEKPPPPIIERIEPFENDLRYARIMNELGETSEEQSNHNRRNTLTNDLRMCEDMDDGNFQNY